jgi:pectate lyase
MQDNNEFHQHHSKRWISGKLTRRYVTFALANLWVCVGSPPAIASDVAAAPPLAFPGALGWAASTPGGRGGQVIRVNTLAASGPGSFAAALNTKGPRIIVFEVGGVIDMQRTELKLSEPFVTIAGQTAPAPGITLIRTGLDISAHDVVMQHVRLRTGTAEAEKRKGWEPDAISTLGGAYNVIVDHCSLSWAVDENLSASGPRFTGSTVDEWRAGTSHRITFSNNIIAEGLARATHSKGEHSKGSLIHDNVTDILIVGNLYAHNYERSPLFKGGVHGAIINNLIYDPGQRAVHYNLIAEEWGSHPYQNGKMTLIGNVLRAGQSTVMPLAMVELGGSGDLELFAKDNIAVDRIGNPLPMQGSYTNSATAKILPLKQPGITPDVKPIATKDVQDSVIRNAGARPWERDATDARIMADTIEGRGEIINSDQDVGGYPRVTETRQAFNADEWDLLTMTRKAENTK